MLLNLKRWKARSKNSPWTRYKWRKCPTTPRLRPLGSKSKYKVIDLELNASHGHAQDQLVTVPALAGPERHQDLGDAAGHLPQIQKDLWRAAFQRATVPVIFILCIIDGLIKSHWFQPKLPLSSPLCKSHRECPRSIRSRSCFRAPGTSGNPDCIVCLFIRGFQCLALGPSAGWISSRGCSPSGRSRSTPSSIL